MTERQKLIATIAGTLSVNCEHTSRDAVDNAAQIVEHAEEIPDPDHPVLREPMPKTSDVDAALIEAALALSRCMQFHKEAANKGIVLYSMTNRAVNKFTDRVQAKIRDMEARVEGRK